MHCQPESGAAVQVRLSGKELDDLENWRRAQEKIPPRSEALREAIRRLVTPPAARITAVENCAMGPIKSPGAVAALGASVADQLGRRVIRKLIAKRQLPQAGPAQSPAQQGSARRPRHDARLQRAGPGTPRPSQTRKRTHQPNSAALTSSPRKSFIRSRNLPPHAGGNGRARRSCCGRTKVARHKVQTRRLTPNPHQEGLIMYSGI